MIDLDSLPLIAFFTLNLLFLLFFIRDIYNNKDQVFIWIFLFLIFAPLGVIFYRSQKEKNGISNNAYNISKNFIIFWPIYIIISSILLFTTLIIQDAYSGQNVDFSFVAEGFFWFGGIFACLGFPVLIIFPIIIASIVMLFTRGNKN